jgi:RNase P subunit RPR2
MRHPESVETIDIHRTARVLHCPNCEQLHVMNIKAIRRAAFRGQDMIVYQCSVCGTEEAEIIP